MEQEVEKFKNGWKYRSPYVIKEHKFRIEIVRVEKAEDSYARISVWSPATLSWNEVWSLWGTRMITRVTQNDTPSFDAFEADEQVLIQKAKAIMGLAS